MKQLLLLFVLLMSISGCKKKAVQIPANTPTLTTTEITVTTQTTAISGGEITDEGSSSVIARGVCYSPIANPTTADLITSNGTGTGSFTSNLTGLALYTTYYVRAYATNSDGTAYGSNVTINATSTIGRRHWWTEQEAFHYFDERGVERVLTGATTTSDHDGIMDWM